VESKEGKTREIDTRTGIDTTLFLYFN